MPISEDEVRWGYKFILGREPESSAIIQQYKTCRNVEHLRTILLGSLEFRQQYHARFKVKGEPSEYFNMPCAVFIHIQKTAGSTTREVLKELFRDRRLCPEEYDDLRSYSPTELAPYSLYAGHFSIDSLKYIPRKNLTLLTMLREPSARLISFYYFNRAHNLSGRSNPPTYMRLASELSAEDFFEHPAIINLPQISNGMARAIFATADFDRLKRLRERLGQNQNNYEKVRECTKSDIARRLSEFGFVGIQEDFDRSISLLCHFLEKPRPGTVNQLKSRKLISEDTSGRFKRVEEQPVSPRLALALEQLTVLDRIVYEQGVSLFEERCAIAGLAPGNNDNNS